MRLQLILIKFIMECSPLRFLDYDMSIMLCEQVRLSREKESIRFRDALFHYGNKTNEDNHYLISSIYSMEMNMLSFNNNKNKVKMVVEKFEECLENTKLQRCTY